MAASPFPYSIERLLKPDESAKEQMIETLSAAFMDDQFTAVATAGDQEFYGDFHYACAVAAFLEGEVYVAKASQEKDRIVGVAVWFPPGQEMFASEVQREQALSILWNRFDEDLKGWWAGAFLPKYAELATLAFGHGVKLNSWHLQVLAVHPDHQRKGISRALTNQMKPQALEANVPFVLEATTEVDVEIYQKLGFKVKGHATFARGIETFQFWAMQLDVEDF